MLCRKYAPPENPALIPLQSVWASHVRVAWSHSPRLAVLMAERFKQNAIRSEIRQLVLANPCKASTVPEALDYLLGTRISPAARPHLKVGVVV